METECASCEVRTGLQVLLQVASISQLTASRLSRQCWIINISQPYRPPRPVTGIALLYSSLFFVSFFSVSSLLFSVFLHMSYPFFFMFQNMKLSFTGYGSPLGYETSRLQHFPDSRLTDGREVVSLTRWPPFSPGRFLVLISVRS
jgi:hypothetical protein